MSFILNPFIFEQLEKFYERELTFPYTIDNMVVDNVNRTFNITIPRTIINTVFDMSVETFKIINVIYKTEYDVTSGSANTEPMNIPYTIDNMVADNLNRTFDIAIPYTIEFTVI